MSDRKKGLYLLLVVVALSAGFAGHYGYTGVMTALALVFTHVSRLTVHWN
jgi:hypothetical protein